MYLGIDLGGTKTAIGLVENNGLIKQRHSFPSIANDFEEYYESLENQIELFFNKHKLNIDQVKAVGVGCAGQIELSSGTIFHSPNLNWSNAPLGNKLRKTFVNASVTVDNDVRAATLGEYLFGLSSRPTVYINIFLGTGIGSGIIIGDRILRGYTNSAGELGLTSIDFSGPRHSSGNRGVYEYYGSGTALERYGRELAQSQLEENPRQLGGNRICDKTESIEAITGKYVGDLAADGNTDAIMLVKKVAQYIGAGMANVINFLNPQVITYGGGLAEVGPILTDTILETVKERAISTAYEKTDILKANLGNDAGIIGAAFLHRVNESGEIS
ncbi:MAG: ROK family protein [bacterium]|nr:ROK family protein [bacterium]